MEDILNIAHKGASAYYPENSILAYKKAIEMKCDGFEVDVQLTKDKVPVMFHDEELDELTNGKGLLCRHTYEELRELEIIKNKSDDFEIQRIPTLDQLLTLVKENNIFLNLELKNNIVAQKGLEEIVCKKIKEYDLIDNTLISSFNHYSLKKIAEICPELDLGILYHSVLYKPEKYADSLDFKIKSINPRYTSLNKKITDNITNKNYKVYPYTINIKKDLEKMIEYGVSGIITDYPDRLDDMLKNK